MKYGRPLLRRRRCRRALEYLVDSHQDLEEFLAHIEEARKANKSSPTEKVTLITIHQAKGLEFKCVIVPGLNEGILPHVNSFEELVNLEEARRQTEQPIAIPSRFLKELSADRC